MHLCCASCFSGADRIHFMPHQMWMERDRSVIACIIYKDQKHPVWNCFRHPNYLENEFQQGCMALQPVICARGCRVIHLCCASFCRLMLARLHLLFWPSSFNNYTTDAGEFNLPCFRFSDRVEPAVILFIVLKKHVIASSQKASKTLLF